MSRRLATLRSRPGKVCAYTFTLPVGGATCPLGVKHQFQEVSIHAPRGGSDRSLTTTRRQSGRFNPRSPWGERQDQRANLVAALAGVETATSRARIAIRSKVFFLGFHGLSFIISSFLWAPSGLVRGEIPSLFKSTQWGADVGGGGTFVPSGAVALGEKEVKGEMAKLNQPQQQSPSPGAFLPGSVGRKPALQHCP
jgi:hypothetical protein